MKAHDLARKLLEGPNLDVVIYTDDSPFYVNVEPEKFEIKKVIDRKRFYEKDWEIEEIDEEGWIKHDTGKFADEYRNEREVIVV